MTGLFQALEARFNAHSGLRLRGRKLYEGFVDEQKKNATFPYTEVTWKRTRGENTFGSHIDVYELRFRYFGKDLKAETSRAWLEDIRQAFMDRQIDAPQFRTAGIALIDNEGPILRDGLYESEAVFEWIVQRRIKSPALAGA